MDARNGQGGYRSGMAVGFIRPYWIEKQSGGMGLDMNFGLRLWSMDNALVFYHGLVWHEGHVLI